MLSEINIPFLLDTARKAGEAIMQVYQSDIAVEIKDDKSPLTLADRAANAIIVEALKNKYPQIPIISEESKLTDYETRRHWSYCWVVDPLDGTKEFIKRNGEFTVNIALVHNGTPVLGVIYVPARNEMYYARQAEGSFKTDASGNTQRINATPIDANQPVLVVASRSHLSQETQEYVDALRQKYATVDFVSSGSSLKFCLVAEGKAHLYPRFAPTMEWDTAAGQVIATEAGATVEVYPDAIPLQYNRENLLNPFFLVRV